MDKIAHTKSYSHPILLIRTRLEKMFFKTTSTNAFFVQNCISILSQALSDMDENST